MPGLSQKLRWPIYASLMEESKQSSPHAVTNAVRIAEKRLKSQQNSVHAVTCARNIARKRLKSQQSSPHAVTNAVRMT